MISAMTPETTGLTTMPKLIAFDLVGTLVDGAIFKAARSSIRVDFNEGWDDAETASGFHSHFDYETVFRHWLDNAPVNSFYRQFKSFLIDNTLNYLYPDAEQALIQLNKIGVRLGFVTDGSDEVEGGMLRAILERCNIEPDLCIIITGERTGSRKRDGAPFRLLVEEAARHGISTENILFVGDKPEADVVGAKKAKLATALIDRRQPPTAEPDYQISTLEELPGLVKSEPHA